MSSISGPDFLVLYGALCVAGMLGTWAASWRLRGPQPDGDEQLPDLELYEIALLGGGAQLAITTAATQLHADGMLRTDRGTLEVTGELGDDAHPLDRALLESVAGEPGITAAALRARLAEREPLASMARTLTDDGLLLDDVRRARLRALWLVPALVLALGTWRALTGFADGEASLLLVLGMFVAFAIWSAWLEWQPRVTHAGRALLRHHRSEREDLRSHAVSGESALTAALFGGAALWLAAPEIAHALDVPREDEPGWAGGSGGCSAGGGCDSAAGAGGGGCGGCGGCGGG